MTGLNSVPLASLNRFQQAILYVLMTIGSTTTVSIVMIYIRLRFFKQRFRDILTSKAFRRPSISAPMDPHPVSKPCPVRTPPPPLGLSNLKFEHDPTDPELMSSEPHSKLHHPSLPHTRLNTLLCDSPLSTPQLPLSSHAGPSHPLQPITSRHSRRNSDGGLALPSSIPSPHVSFSPNNRRPPLSRPTDGFPRSFTLGGE